MVSEILFWLFLTLSLLVILVWLSVATETGRVLRQYSENPVVEKRQFWWLIAQNSSAVAWSICASIWIPLLNSRETKTDWQWQLAQSARVVCECTLLSCLVTRVWLIHFTLRVNALTQDRAWMSIIDSRWLVFDNDAIKAEQMNIGGLIFVIEEAEPSDNAAQSDSWRARTMRDFGLTLGTATSANAGNLSPPATPCHNEANELVLGLSYPSLKLTNPVSASHSASQLSNHNNNNNNSNNNSKKGSSNSIRNSGLNHGSSSSNRSSNDGPNRHFESLPSDLDDNCEAYQKFDSFWLRYESTFGSGIWLYPCVILLTSLIIGMILTIELLLEWNIIVDLIIIIILNLSSVMLIGWIWMNMRSHRMRALVDLHREVRALLPYFGVFVIGNLASLVIPSGLLRMPVLFLATLALSTMNLDPFLRPAYLIFTQGKVQFGHRYYSAANADAKLSRANTLDVTAGASHKKNNNANHKISKTPSLLHPTKISVATVSVEPSFTDVLAEATPQISASPAGTPSEKREQSSAHSPRLPTSMVSANSNSSRMEKTPEPKPPTVLRRLSLALTPNHDGTTSNEPTIERRPTSHLSVAMAFEYPKFDSREAGRSVSMISSPMMRFRAERLPSPGFAKLFTRWDEWRDYWVDTAALTRHVDMVRKRGLTSILAEVEGLCVFMQYLDSELCTENLLALIEFDQFEKKFNEFDDENDDDVENDDDTTDTETDTTSTTAGSGINCERPVIDGSGTSSNNSRGVLLPNPQLGVFPHSTLIYGQSAETAPSMADAFCSLIGKYVSPGSKHEVNVSYATRKQLLFQHTKVKQSMKQRGTALDLSPFVFSPIKKELITVLKRNFDRWTDTLQFIVYAKNAGASQ